MESPHGLAGLSPDVLGDAAVCVNSSVALERYIWPLLPAVVPFFRESFFKVGMLGLWLGSVNLRMRSRTELERLNCSNVTSFFSGAVKKITRRELKHGA